MMPAMTAEHAAIDMDDLARLARPRLQPLDDVGVAPGGHEADVLAVVLVGDREPERAGRLPRLGLGHAAEREAEELELLRGRGEQEVALVAVEVGRTVQGAAAVDAAAPPT